MGDHEPSNMPMMACAAVVVIIVIIIIIVVMSNSSNGDNSAEASALSPRTRCGTVKALQEPDGQTNATPEETRTKKKTAYSRYKEACKHRDIGDSDRRSSVGPRVSRLSHTGTNYMDLFGNGSSMAEIARKKQEAIQAQPAHVLQVPSNDV